MCIFSNVSNSYGSCLLPTKELLGKLWLNASNRGLTSCHSSSLETGPADHPGQGRFCFPCQGWWAWNGRACSWRQGWAKRQTQVSAATQTCQASQFVWIVLAEAAPKFEEGAESGSPASTGTYRKNSKWTNPHVVQFINQYYQLMQTHTTEMKLNFLWDIRARSTVNIIIYFNIWLRSPLQTKTSFLSK